MFIDAPVVWKLFGVPVGTILPCLSMKCSTRPPIAHRSSMECFTMIDDVFHESYEPPAAFFCIPKSNTTARLQLSESVTTAKKSLKNLRREDDVSGCSLPANVLQFASNDPDGLYCICVPNALLSFVSAMFCHPFKRRPRRVS